MRFYEPEFGTIFVDGVNIRDYDLVELRKSMGLVMQEPVLFNYSIKENILYGKMDATNADIVRACEVSNAIEFITKGDADAMFDDQAESLLAAVTGPYKEKMVELLGEQAFEKSAEPVVVPEGKTREDVVTELGEKEHAKQVLVLEKLVKKEEESGKFKAINNLIDTRADYQKGDIDLHPGFEISAGNRGNRLSGGQKQRIAIARAVIRNPQILLLDEATSALDEIAQRLVQDALNNVMQNRTSIVIAHRLTTVEKCDRVAVLEDGVIVEEGQYSDLRNQPDSHFAILADGMAKKQEEELEMVRKASSYHQAVKK